MGAKAAAAAAWGEHRASSPDFFFVSATLCGATLMLDWAQPRSISTDIVSIDHPMVRRSSTLEAPKEFLTHNESLLEQ